MINLLIDGNHLAHRCRYVFSLSHKGVDVSVTYGFLRNIESLMRKFKPYSIVVCWDGGVPEFRRQAVPEYKANRDHGDIDDYQNFLRQIQELSDYALPMLGVVSARRVGAEGDDLLYHASRILKGTNIIVSGDHDLLQAMNENTQVYVPIKEVLYDVAKFEKEYGLPFHDFLDWRALIGDSSDNIPGVRGIGEKTATKLFNEFRTLTNITNAATGSYPGPEKLSPKLAAAIAGFGFERIAKNVLIMALYADRVGAKESVIQAVNQHKPADPVRIKKYFLRQAFTSLMEMMPNAATKLHRPELVDLKTVRVPRICYNRQPLLS